MINPSTSYTIPFVTMVAGVPTGAASTPTAVVWRNGSAEATSVTVSTTSNTGIYHAAFTTGSGWAKTDRIWLVISATISSVEYRGIAWDSFSEPDAVMRGTDGANTTTPPTVAAIASQTRTELATELGRIDAQVSSRLAASAYTAPPSIAGLASQTSVDGIGNRLPSTLDGGLIRAKVESESAGLAKETTVIAVGQAVVSVGNNVTTLLNRIPQDIFTGITRLARWLGVLAGKTADSATLTEIQATTGGAGFNNTTDSLEAIRDRGDVAWVGGAGNGEFQLTITVSDGTTGVANCRVSLVGTGLFAFTNTNGVATPFNVAGSTTYAVRVTPPVTFDTPSDTSVVVAAQNVSQTIVVTAKPPVNPSAAPQCNVVLPVTDGAGSALTGAKVSIEFIRFESGATPSSVVIPPVPELTSAAGVVTVPLLRFGRYRATYSYQNGIKDFEFVVPDSGSATIVEQV